MTMPAPKFATKRDPSRPSRGPRQAEFARIWLRRPLLEWQRYVADVAGELEPSGRPRYPLVVVTVQRQAGKSHLSMARAGERCLSRKNFRSFYTAQTGNDAQEQFLKFNDEIVVGSPLEKLVVTRRGNGKADMTFANGSTITPRPPTEGAGHGKQSDLYDVDEAWAFDEEQGAAIMQAIGPTQLTRPDAQTWIWSAGGTAASTWLASLVARGREGDPSIAYFEWGIPDDLSLDDIDAIAEHHPAFGELVTADSLRALRTMLPSDAAFARAAGNRWTEVIGGVIAADVWAAVKYPDPLPDDPRASVGYGAARAADGSQVVICAAVDVGGVPVVEVLDVLPSGYRAEQTVMAWATDGPLAVDPIGPSSPLADSIAQAEFRPLLKLGTRDVTAACGHVMDALPHGGIRFRPHPSLDAAVRVLGKRAIGDGGFVWSRTGSAAPIASFEAATLAVHALRHRPKPIGKPRILTPSAASA